MSEWQGTEFTALLDAIEVAEGGRDALIRAVQCSIPSIRTYDEARQVARNTVIHALWDSVMSEARDADAFIDFLATRWAPRGAANDPTNLNSNWPRNVKAAFHRER